MADLLTLAEYKALVGIDPTDNRNDPQITALLPAASRAVRNYAERSFDIASGPASTRTFLYDGSGILDVDDFTTLTSISTDLGVVGGVPYDFSAQEYTAMPAEGEVYYWIVLYGGPVSPSPEMGFERNLDTLDLDGRQPTISVTATWGWPAIPEDVKLAAAWTIQDTMRTPQGPTAESIEGFSRSWGVGTAAMQSLAIPNRARDLLASYQRVFA